MLFSIPYVYRPQYNKLYMFIAILSIWEQNVLLDIFDKFVHFLHLVVF